MDIRVKSLNDAELAKFIQLGDGVIGVRIVSDADDTRFDPDDDAPDYIGLFYGDSDADTANENWVVMKFTRSSGNVTRIQRKTGAWDNRATLF